MAFPPLLSSPFSDRRGSRGTLSTRPHLVGRVSYPTSSFSGRVVTIGGDFVSTTGNLPPVSTLSGRRGFPSGRPLGLLTHFTDLHNHGDFCHCVLCSPMRGSLRVDRGDDEPSSPGGNSRFSFLPSSVFASPRQTVDSRDVDAVPVSIPSSPSYCASESSVFFSPASSPLALEVDGVPESDVLSSGSSLSGVIRSDYAQSQVTPNGSDYAHSITHTTCDTEVGTQDCSVLSETLSDDYNNTPIGVVRNLLSEFDLMAVDRDSGVVRQLDFDSIFLAGDQLSPTNNAVELVSESAVGGQIQNNQLGTLTKSPPSTTITESFPALIACKFSSNIDTSRLLQGSSAFSILFNGNHFNCYRKILSHFRALSEHAFFILDHVLPQSGPVYCKDLGILLSYVIFIFDMKMLKLPSLVVNSCDGYSFLHFVDLEDTDAYEVIATLLTFDGFVGADLGGVNPIAMIQTAASVGAANIAANDASVAYRSTLEALTPVSTILNENDMAHIKRERAVNFKQNNVVSNDHPLMAAYREIIRDDYRKMINLQTTNLRTLVLGATSREYSAYQSNKFVCFQLANREGKDTDRMVMDFLKDIRAKNKKKATCNSRSINSLARKKSELVSVDQMIEMWKNNRVLPSRFLTWEQSQSLIEHGLVKDKIESNPDVEAAILATHVDSRGTFEVIRDVFNDKLLTLIKKRTKDSECSFDQIVFEDVGYNFSEYDWYKIMSNTGATVAYGYMCLPWQLVFPDMCPPPGYVYRESGGYSYFAYEGFSNGYVHKTKYWATFMRKPVINVKGKCYGIEIVSRAGPMACVKVYATDNPEKFTRNLSLPKYLQTVRLLDVRRSVDKRTNTIDMNGLVYFPVRLEEYLEALNYSLDLSRESLSPRNIMLYARRRVAGLSLVTKQIAHTWTIDAANIPDFAHDIYLVALYTLLVFDSACDQFKGMDDSAARRFVMRSAATLGYPLKKLFELFQRSRDFLKYIVKDTDNSSWQDEMGYGSTRMLNSKLFIGTNPEDKLDPSYSIDEEADEDNSPCLFCAELQMFCGTQKFTCTRAIDEDFDFELGLNSEQLRNLRSSLSATDNDPVGLKQVKEEALKNVPPAEFSTPVKIQYLCGPPGTGKSHLIRAIATKKDLVLAPYSRLREDYTNFTHPVTGARCSLKFATQHSGMSSLNHGRIFVDEYTAFPYECLAVIAFRCAAKEVVLVGDHRQPSIIDTVEGLAITKQIPLARIRKHELIKNYRNPADTVSVLNTLYAYNMEATNTRRGYSFDTVDNYHNYSSMTPLFFRHQTAERFGVSRGFNEKVTVRANQGATYDDVALVVTNSDADLLRMPSLAIVALSRHRNRCVILHENSDEAAIFAGMIRGGINQPPPPPPRDDASSNDSDSDGDGPDVAPVIVRNTVGRTVRIMPNDRVQHIEPTEEPVNITIESLRMASNQNTVNNQSNNEQTNTDATQIDSGGDAQPEQVVTNVGTDVDDIDPDMPELETDSDIVDREMLVDTDVSANIPQTTQINVPSTSITNTNLLASSDINTSRGLSLSIPGVSNETQSNSIILRELFNYNSNIRNYSVNTGRDVALVSGVGSILIDDVDQSEHEVLNNEPSLSITTTLGDSNVRIPVPSENTCLIRTISEVTGRTMEDIWVDLVSCIGGDITQRVSTVGLNTSDLESYMNRIQRRCRLIRSNTNGEDDQVYTIGSNGDFIGTIRFSGPPNLGHFESIQNSTVQASTSENENNDNNASATITESVRTNQNTSGVDNQNMVETTAPAVIPTGVQNVETATQRTVQTPQQAVLEMLNNMYTSYSQSTLASTSAAANVTTSFGNNSNRMGVSNQVVVTSAPQQGITYTPSNQLTVPPVLSTLPNINITRQSVRPVNTSVVESVDNAYMQTAYTDYGVPYYAPTIDLVNQPNIVDTNVGRNNNTGGITGGDNRNRTTVNSFSGQRPQNWAGVVRGNYRGRGRGQRGHGYNRGGRNGPNFNNPSFHPNQSVSRPHGPEAFNNLLVAPYNDPSMLVNAVRYVLNAYLPQRNSPQVDETRRHIAQLLLASELGLIQLQRLAQLLNSVYFSFHPSNDSPHCIMTMEQLNSHLCTINLIIASRSSGFSLRYLGSTGIVVTTQPPVGNIGDTNYVEQQIIGSGRQQQNSLLLTPQAIDQIIGVGASTNTNESGQNAQQTVQTQLDNTDQPIEGQPSVNAYHIPSVQVNTNLVYPGLQGRVLQQVGVVINDNVLNTIENMRVSNNRSNQLTTIGINEAVMALYNMFDDFGQEIDYLNTDGQTEVSRLSFFNRIRLSARRHWLNWFINNFGSDMLDQNITDIIDTDQNDDDDGRHGHDDDAGYTAQQNQNYENQNQNRETRPNQNTNSPDNLSGEQNQVSFSREVPDYTGGAEINIVPLSKRHVVEPLEIDYEPYGDQDTEFTAYARHFLDPIKVTTRLVVVNVHPREAIVPLELASYDAFRMLKTEFATMDEDDFTLTNQESLDYIESDFGCGVFDTTKLDNLNPRGHPKSLQEKAWSLLAVSPGVTYFKSNLSQSLSCLQSRYLTKKMVATFNHESIDKANEIADLFCYEHMSINYDIFNDEDLYTTMIESEKAMKQKNYDKQVKFEIGGDGDVRFSMKDIFKPFKTNINLFKAGQGISAWSRDNQTIFQTPFRVINKHFINCLKPHVVYDNGIDEITMMNRVNALFSLLPMSCLNGVIDATACDSGQNRFTQRIERRILERLGISDEFLNWYYSLRESYTLKGYGVTAKIKDIKTSGEPATLLNNTILMACLMNYLIRGQGPSVIVIKGDDGLKRQACIKYDDVARNSLKRFLKMEFKVDIDVPITFCGYFLHDRFLIPDIVRKVFKIIGHRFRNYEHFAEYQKSLRDWILASNKLGINDMCHITSKAYKINHTYCYELFFAIVSLSHISRRQFEKEFTLRTYDFNQRYYISPKWSQKTPWYSGDN